MGEQGIPKEGTPGNDPERFSQRLLWAWLSALLITQLLFCYALRDPHSSLKPIHSFAGTIPFVAIWLPLSFLLANLFRLRINRSSFKAWPLLLAFPIVLAVSFVTSILGVALAELVHNQAIRSHALSSWGSALGSAILTAPLLALFWLWLARRYRGGQPA
jgi:hypothetical protein